MEKPQREELFAEGGCEMQSAAWLISMQHQPHRGDKGNSPPLGLPPGPLVLRCEPVGSGFPSLAYLCLAQ